MERTSVREMPIGVNAQVRYKGCDVNKWLEFDNEIARVRLVSRGSAACVLKNGKISWVRINELERVPPQEMQSTVTPPPPISAPTVQEQFAPDQDLPQSPVVSSTRKTQEGFLAHAACSRPAQTTQEKLIAPTRRTTVREMPITWRGFRPQ